MSLRFDGLDGAGREMGTSGNCLVQQLHGFSEACLVLPHIDSLRFDFSS